MKKFLSLSLALILCVALSVPAFAANYTSYTWSDEYTTMKFDAAAVATETIKAWDYDSEEYTNQNVTMITVKPGSSVTVTGDSMFTLSELTEDGYGEDYMGAEIKTGAVDDIFTNFPAGALFVVEYGKTYIKLGGVDEQPTAPAQPTAPTQPTAPAQPEQPAAPVAAGSYTVKKGDTYGTIALNNYGTYGVWSELYKANKGVKLTEGATLVLPETLGKVARINAPAAASGETLYTVKAGDTLGAIAKATYGDVMKYKTIFERNADRLVNANTIYEGQVIVLPVK
ncbi:Proline-rich protein [Intestinimonas butyriciproducens]|uniref:Proline-rich protein n=2 Tax=Intestinimonas butyriciproducens TaxID=1297617 RepID=A0A0S2W5E1_9FIRM|nr:Proline-rich protein [Intestinimonas butyriciproducens]